MRLSANSVCETNGRALAGMAHLVQGDSLSACPGLSCMAEVIGDTRSEAWN
jgi:hypothetical protein